MCVCVFYKLLYSRYCFTIYSAVHTHNEQIRAREINGRSCAMWKTFFSKLYGFKHIEKKCSHAEQRKQNNRINLFIHRARRTFSNAYFIIKTTRHTTTNAAKLHRINIVPSECQSNRKIYENYYMLMCVNRVPCFAYIFHLMQNNLAAYVRIAYILNLVRTRSL